MGYKIPTLETLRLLYAAAYYCKDWDRFKEERLHIYWFHIGRAYACREAIQDFKTIIADFHDDGFVNKKQLLTHFHIGYKAFQKEYDCRHIFYGI